MWGPGESKAISCVSARSKVVPHAERQIRATLRLIDFRITFTDPLFLRKTLALGARPRLGIPGWGRDRRLLRTALRWEDPLPVDDPFPREPMCPRIPR